MQTRATGKFKWTQGTARGLRSRATMVSFSSQKCHMGSALLYHFSKSHGCYPVIPKIEISSPVFGQHTRFFENLQGPYVVSTSSSNSTKGSWRDIQARKCSFLAKKWTNLGTLPAPAGRKLLTQLFPPSSR